MPASALRAKFGDPVRITQGTGERVARYWIPGSDTTFFLVTERSGYIVAFHAFTETTPNAPITNVLADPSGVRLGDAMQSVEHVHPGFTTERGDQGEPVLMGPGPLPRTAIVYDFDHGRVHSFAWLTGEPPPTPLPPLSEPGGASVADAIMDVQPNEFDGIHWEYIFIAFQPCDGSTPWRPWGEQSLAIDHGKPYDVDSAVCPTTHARRDFYFDISGFYGKL